MSESQVAMEVAKAEEIAIVTQAIADSAWEKARQRDSFQDACISYNQEMLSSIYGILQEGVKS